MLGYRPQCRFDVAGDEVVEGHISRVLARLRVWLAVSAAHCVDGRAQCGVQKHLSVQPERNLGERRLIEIWRRVRQRRLRVPWVDDRTDDGPRFPQSRTQQVPDDPAAQVDLALDRMKSVLEAASLDLRHMVFVNPYLTEKIPTRVMNERYARRFEFGNTPARATIEVSSLPGGAHIEYTGVAVRDLKQRRAVRPKNMPPSPTASPCVFAGNTLYCSAKSGFIPGAHGGVYANTTAHQLRQTMRNQLDNLEEAEMTFDQVVPWFLEW